MLGVLFHTITRHDRILIVTLDLLIVLKAKEIFQLREFVLMARHEVVHIVNGVRCPFITCRILIAESLVGLLGLTAVCEQEHLVGVGQALQMLAVPLECLVDLLGQLAIQTQTSELTFWSVCLRKVLIIEIVKPAVFLLRHIANAVEGLNVPTSTQIDVKTRSLSHKVELPSICLLTFC